MDSDRAAATAAASAVTPPTRNASIPSLVGRKWWLAQIELLQTLAKDNRPSFIVNAHEKTKVDLVWYNPAFSRRYSTPPASTRAETSNNAEGSSREAGPGANLDAPLRDWVLGRLVRFGEVPGSAEANATVAYTICPRTLLWSHTVIEQNGTPEWILFTGVPLGDVAAGVDAPDAEAGKLPLMPAILEKFGPTPVEATTESRIQRFLENQQTEVLGPSGGLSPEKAEGSSTTGNSSQRWTPSDSGASTQRPASTVQPSMLESRQSDHTIFDWTRLPSDCELPSHIKMLRNLDWTQTPLGDITEWPQSLRTLMSLMTSYRTPVAMFLGKRFTVVYNEAYIQVAGTKHPRMMGKDFRIFWSELWEGLKDEFAHVFESGETLLKDEDLLFLERHGFPEETYFTWTVIPMYGEDGTIIGLLNQAFELTRRVVAERRMLTLQKIGELTSRATTVKEFWIQFFNGLEWNELDTPFALLYSRQGDLMNRSESSRSSNFDYIVELEASLGVHHGGHLCAPELIDLRSDDAGFAKAFRAAHLQEYLLVDVGDELCPHEMLHGLQLRGFSDPTKQVVICPVYAHGKEDVATAYLVLGINPRRPFDEDYALFIQLLTRQLTTSLGTVLLFQAEVRRNQQAARLAAMEKILMSEQLASRTKQAQDSEKRFARLAEVAPVGIFISDGQGQVTFTNDTFYDITQHPRGCNPSDWMESVHPDWAEKVSANWNAILAKGGVSHPMELRWKTPFLSPLSGEETERWTLGSYFVEKDEAGHVRSVFGCMTNISEQKFSENTQRRRWEAAAELKRQQDNFVDMASHEMRNPLSAILQCSDHIVSSLNFCRGSGEELSDQTLDNLSACIDAAQTILLCATHQKRVVDDILTMSKLDSTRLSVTPVDVQPESVVQQALGMFEQESIMKNIQLSSELDPSYIEHSINWIRLDPTRLLQVLINLITNALKFVRTGEQQAINIKIGASDRMPEYDNGLVFMRAGNGKMMRTSQAQQHQEAMEQQMEEDDPNRLYLTFEVKDNGKGMTKAEMNTLFQRFNQATPRTHVQYGGSGLGLFICRELVNLQGGEIGVRSESGKGSSFHFYIVVQRGLPPHDQNHVESVTTRSYTTIPLPKSPGLPPSSSHTTPSLPSSSSIPLSNSPLSSVPATPHPMGKSVALSPHLDLSLKKTKITPIPARPHKLSQAYKILIVEDNLVNQKVVQRQLQNLGCETRVANHGIECLDVIRRSSLWNNDMPTPSIETPGLSISPPITPQVNNHNQVEILQPPFKLSVVLMDIEMPVMDGLTATREIRKLQAAGKILSHVPIIAVTANARPEQMKVMLDAGVDDILSKPFRIPELIAKLEQVVGGSGGGGDVETKDADGENVRVDVTPPEGMEGADGLLKRTETI